MNILGNYPYVDYMFHKNSQYNNDIMNCKYANDYFHSNQNNFNMISSLLEMNANPNNIHTYTTNIRDSFKNKYNTSHTLNIIPKIKNFKLYLENPNDFDTSEHIIKTDDCNELNKDNATYNLAKLLSLLQDATIEPELSNDNNNNGPTHMLNKTYTDNEIKNYELNTQYIKQLNILLDEYNKTVNRQMEQNQENQQIADGSDGSNILVLSDSDDVEFL